MSATVLSGFAFSLLPQTRPTASICASIRVGEKSPLRINSLVSRHTTVASSVMTEGGRGERDCRKKRKKKEKRKGGSADVKERMSRIRAQGKTIAGCRERESKEQQNFLPSTHRAKKKKIEKKKKKEQKPCSKSFSS